MRTGAECRLDVPLVQGVQHAAHERTSSWQHTCAAKDSFPIREAVCVPSRDDSLAEEGAEHGGQLLHALRSAGHGLCDRVQLDAKEGQALGRPLRLVLLHDQAELTNDRLCGEQVAGHVFL